MKRNLLIAAAVAGLFSAGTAAVASASTTSVTTHVRCRMELTTAPPYGTTTVTPGTTSGTQYGGADCTHMHGGTARTMFTTDASGELTGSIDHWFDGGMLSGTFTLAQTSTSGPPTGTTFATSTFSGTVKITGSHGLLVHTRGTGTLSCTTSDGDHFACTEHLKLTQTS